MIEPKTDKELEHMRESGKISALALNAALEAIKPGISAKDIDKLVEEEIYRKGGDLSYKTVPGYKWATCITFNEQVVHGIPTDRKVKEGDLVSVDLAVSYKGWHTDCAWSVLVDGGKIEDRRRKIEFLRIGKEALRLGIKEAKSGNTVGDIGAAIQKKVEVEEYHVVRALVGHGVGKALHEEPEIPGYGVSGTGSLLIEGMTLAIEVIYAEGTPDVILEKDGWTYSTEDGSLSGLFEMTVVVGKKEAKILTDWRKV
ncbi:type I methionyl aminopeptidase [Candidatus Daviesbacteria bacterium RIFCSPHIGHO2_12_FULL_37_11]|uniref:Methionine aminopeptidase n=1 Tax=Candidatus Daviesbacteria bacterium RIFCSPHIGHO2_12_FULL_37_11 TaxID=1797777 RepID=A0A1F5KC84_9BACT|nr:MAG: type I methionyl aminopeptidase [Candidatus Daviesbacteria bacterium GWA1_38_6]OGE16452.1 MAG: type I methionyl aminopeptidase [Candidatus Daviesbacteria bacterium RIFCSPHIGHO2_01_FULL_37_27]OGE38547.1 MAG: type I methionyl aminopeptidase [Candidatus Daviesbacteria bacterium RIFCSPHIGHO2_12_FULL_37_11]OGE46142.1 MAG: type I methionyl aminopeptidase [Candidatus Daviesbacteria bacterium RIFCSPLOWO2_01_FULL_37_10]